MIIEDNDMRTKQEEIDLLRQTAAELGKDSYCGPWLAEVADHVESDIRADMLPVPTVGAWRRYCGEMQAEAKDRADGIIAAATDKAREREGKAHREVEAAATALRAALRTLGSL